MAQAMDLIDDNNVEIEDKKEKSYLLVILEWFESLLDEFKPFKNDLRDIQVGYDKSIFVFYEIAQYMYIFSVINAGIYSYLLITHYLKYKDTVEYYQGLCGYFFPCFFFLSRFQEDVKFEFILTHIVFLVSGLFYCMYLWVKFDKKAKYQEIF